MIGYVQNAVAEAIKGWETLKKANVMPIRAVDAGSASTVVNTTLPAIAIEVNGVEGHGNTFIGGGIRLYFELRLHLLTDTPNYTFTYDNERQAKTLDLSTDVIDCIENSKALDEIKRKYDLNIVFSDLETDTTQGSKGSITAFIDVQILTFECDARHLTRVERERLAELERVEIESKPVKSNLP